MLFVEPTLQELIKVFLGLLRNSERFLKPENQIEISMQLKDDINNQLFELRNSQIDIARELHIRRGTAGFTVTYSGTNLRCYQGFDVLEQRFKHKFFVGYIGNDKVDQTQFTKQLGKELRRMVFPRLNTVIFPALFV